MAVATCWGIGRLGRGAGTVAALAVLPVHWLLAGLALPVHAAAVAAVTLAAGLASDRAARQLGLADPQVVVADEAAGALIALAFVRDGGPVAALAALVLFRIFDIAKPWPVYALERLRPPGLAIMADDVAAALLAGAAVVAAMALAN